MTILHIIQEFRFSTFGWTGTHLYPLWRLWKRNVLGNACLRVKSTLLSVNPRSAAPLPWLRNKNPVKQKTNLPQRPWSLQTAEWTDESSDGNKMIFCYHVLEGWNCFPLFAMHSCPTITKLKVIPLFAQFFQVSCCTGVFYFYFYLFTFFFFCIADGK